MFRSFLGSAFLIAASVLAAPSAATASLAALYEGKTVTILVGYGPGGTYGQTAQLLSKHINKEIPGHPTIVVQYMPGAGGMKMANYAYNVMPKNGLFFLMPPESVAIAQLLQPGKVKYVASKFTWIGRAFGVNQILVVRRDTGVASIKDLKNKQVIVASSGAMSSNSMVPAIANGALGARFKIVVGYSGMAKGSLSVETGETSGLSGPWSYWKKNRSAWFAGGDKSFVVPVLQSGQQKEKDLPDVPLLLDVLANPDARAAATLLATSAVVGRGFAFPPGVPAHVIEPIRTAFWNTVNGEPYKSDARRIHLLWSPMKGADVQKSVNAALQITPEGVAKARKYLFDQ